jgi:ABC-type Zn uptake system ZnuABC Zn-binding protein ZnuA
MWAYRGFYLCLTFLILTSGCGKGAAQQPHAPEKIYITATAYPLADIARQVGGDSVRCDWIAERGQSLDASDPTAEVVNRLRKGDIVLANGVGEDWAVNGFDDPMRNRSFIRLDLLNSAQPSLASACRQLWLDPAVAKELASTIAQRLITKRPRQEKVFPQNALKFAGEVDAITNEFAMKLAPLRGRKVLVLSSDYFGLLNSLGIGEVQPVTASPLRLSDDDLRTLRDSVRTDKPIGMLVEVDVPLAVQQDLARRLAIPVIPLDSLGTSAGVGRNTYQAILRYDLEQLSEIPIH